MALNRLLLGQRLDDLNDLFASVALDSTEVDQLAHPANDDTLLRCSGNSDAPASLKVEEPFVPEDAQRTKDGVLIHCQDGRHILSKR